MARVQSWCSENLCFLSESKTTSNLGVPVKTLRDACSSSLVWTNRVPSVYVTMIRDSIKVKSTHNMIKYRNRGKQLKWIPQFKVGLRSQAGTHFLLHELLDTRSLPWIKQQPPCCFWLARTNKSPLRDESSPPVKNSFGAQRGGMLVSPCFWLNLRVRGYVALRVFNRVYKGHTFVLFQCFRRVMSKQITQILKNRIVRAD